MIYVMQFMLFTHNCNLITCISLQTTADLFYTIAKRQGKELREIRRIMNELRSEVRKVSYKLTYVSKGYNA